MTTRLLSGNLWESIRVSTNLKGNHVATCIRPSAYWGTKKEIKL